jgi:hypothetical protein
MYKKFFFKAVAIMVCLVFLTLCVPGLISAEKKSPKPNSKLLFEKPLRLISSIFPVFSYIFDTGSQDNFSKNAPSSTSSGKVKITGGLASPKVSDGD